MKRVHVPPATSSITPLQSSSAPLQTSLARVPATHESLPPVQLPFAAHRPTPQAVAKPSTVPLQSLSRLSQVSALEVTSWTHPRAPAAQLVSPEAHTPWRPVLHAAPPPGFPLSTTPLQSLSAPSQTSADGFTFRTQATAPATHACVPAAQTPGWPVPHAAPPPGFPSSGLPLQLLSRPSQISADGFTFLRHWIAPPLQLDVPAAQTPVCPVAQATPPPGFPSSTTPSQSLSAPSQVSATGEPATHELTPPVHVPAEAQAPTPQVVAKESTVPSQSLSRPSHASAEGFTFRVHATAPPWQVCVPAAQTPACPVEQAAPPPGLPSSICPLQSLSTPSQISTPGGFATHEFTPATHEPVLEHCPTPQLVANPSTLPLQSLSRPSHTSAEGFRFLTHWSDPPVQVWVPPLHTPACPVEQGA